VGEYWNGNRSKQKLFAEGADFRERYRQQQTDPGLDVVPANDFSYYDHILDMCAMVGAVPDRFPLGQRHGRH
jgi:5-methyltetrahydropteroyltriglutamate--homocysteine methyltransferase